MKRILIISDTHIPSNALSLPEIIIEEAKKSDIIVHAGDLITIDVIYELQSYAKEVLGVRGNIDKYDERNNLPEKIITKIEKVNIGITHGSGAPWGIIKRINKAFTEDELNLLDIIVFGHTHHPLIEKKGRILYLNPGSPTDKIHAPYNSYIILNIEGTEAQPRLIKI